MAGTKQMENLILIGYMGSGKSTIGVKLSYKLHRTFIDTDKMIEQRAAKSISQIFADEGEEAFRRMETELLQELITKKSYTCSIISLGGGTPMREENRALIRQLGTVVYLKVSPETVYNRIRGDQTRPLLQTEDPLGRMREMLTERGPKYEACADVVIDCDGCSSDAVAAKIIEKTVEI